MTKFKDTINTIQIKFDSHDWACFHDAILDSTGKSHSQKKLQTLFDKLPEDIKYTAYQWGMNDTVFGDEVYRHFKPKPKIKPEPKNTKGREPMLIITTGSRGVGKSWNTSGPNIIRLHTPLEGEKKKYKYISVDKGMPEPDELCWIKITVDLDKKKEVLKDNIKASITAVEQSEIELTGRFSSYTKDWIVDFKINPAFQKVTHWKYF